VEIYFDAPREHFCFSFAGGGYIAVFIWEDKILRKSTHV